MKTIFTWTLGAVLCALPLVGGCVQEPSGAAADTASVVPVSTNTPAPAAATDEAVPPTGTNVVNLEDAEIIPVSDEKPIPADLKLNAPTLEIVKLAHSGIDEGVMLTYVTNSPSTYNLSADQIIYLKDIGVPASVVTAMIQRDDAIKTGVAANPIPIPGAPEPEATNEAPANTAAAPPTPDQVAPQAEGTTAAPEPAPQAPANVTYNTFYESLSPYGTWVYVEGYGRCWQPTVVAVNPGWRPYYDGGRWLYTDNGWYWYSDYSWGWAPFHYGRWFRHHRVGWCWAPDLYWGPSWVTFRYTDGYCGWAPLPPAAYWRPGFGFSYYGSSVAVNFSWGLGYDCYTFVPVRHFHSHYVHRYGVHHNHSYAKNIYNQSTVVNNVVIRNNKVVNNGIPVNHVSRQSGTKITRVAVKPESGPGAPANRGERLSTKGNSLTVYRPDLLKNQNASRNPPQQVNRLAQRPRPTQTVTAVPSTLASARGSQKPGSVTPGRTTVPRVTEGGTAVEPRSAMNNGSTLATRTQPALTAPRPGVDSDSPKAVNRLNSRPQPQTAVQPQTPAKPQAPTRTSPLVLRGEQGKSSDNTPAMGNWPTRQAPAVQPPAPTVTAPAARQNPAAPRQSTPQTIIGQSRGPSTAVPQAPQVAPQRTWNGPQAPASQATVGSGNRLNQRPQGMQGAPAPAARPAPSYTPPAPSYTPAPQRQFTPSTPAPQRPQTFSMPAPQQQQQAFAAPSRTPTPSFTPPAARPAPSFNAPVTRPNPAPAPSFSAPAGRPAPSPSFSAPAPRMSAPAPSFSPPPRSEGGFSGNRMNDRSGGGRR